MVYILLFNLSFIRIVISTMTPIFSITTILRLILDLDLNTFGSPRYPLTGSSILRLLRILLLVTAVTGIFLRSLTTAFILADHVLVDVLWYLLGSLGGVVHELVIVHVIRQRCCVQSDTTGKSFEFVTRVIVQVVVPVQQIFSLFDRRVHEDFRRVLGVAVQRSSSIIGYLGVLDSED